MIEELVNRKVSTLEVRVLKVMVEIQLYDYHGLNKKVGSKEVRGLNVKVDTRIIEIDWVMSVEFELYGFTI